MLHYSHRLLIVQIITLHIILTRDEDTLDEGSDDDFFNEDHKTVDTVIEGVNKQIKEEAEKAVKENEGK